MKKMYFITILLFIGSFWEVIGSVNIVAAKTAVTDKSYAGDYYLQGHYKEPTEKHGAYNVSIKEIKNGNATFYVSFVGRNYSPLYEIYKKNVRIKGKCLSFSWHDGWNNSGKGTIRFVRPHKIMLNMIQTKTAKENRGTLDTNGEKVFLRYRSDYSNGWYGTELSYGIKNRSKSSGVFKGKISDTKVILHGSIDYSKTLSGLWYDEKRILQTDKKRIYNVLKQCKYFFYGEFGKKKISRKEYQTMFRNCLKKTQDMQLMLLFKVSKGKITEMGFSS